MHKGPKQRQKIYVEPEKMNMMMYYLQMFSFQSEDLYNDIFMK